MKTQHTLAALAVAALVGSASAQTVAYWNFENGTNGAFFSDTPATDSSGNGYLMHGFNDFYGPSYSTDTWNGSGLSSDHVGHNDGYTLNSTINAWSPQTWTIEMTFKLDNLGGWQTLIGRDGSSSGGPESDFYLQKNGIDNRLRINFYTVGGQRVVADSNFVLQTDQWYHTAVVSDGSAVRMYVDKLDTLGFQEVAMATLTGGTAAANALATPNANWTFGRGWYNGGFGDNISGNLDDIRFTETALAPTSFIHAIPEPSTYAAFAGALALGLALRRRRS